MTRLGYSQRLLAASQETSWVAALRWICETPGSFLQAWKPNLVSIARVALSLRGDSLTTLMKQTFIVRMPVY